MTRAAAIAILLLVLATACGGGALTRFGDHDLTDPLVIAKLQERFGDEIPAEEPVISPAEMFESDLLVTVTERE